MDFGGKSVVVTGGTGALGSAVVGLLLDEGASCHIPSHSEGELDRFPHAGHERVSVVTGVDLTDESAVESFYGGAGDLWASVHIAGGFSMNGLSETSSDDFMKQMKMNALTCFLCCREASKRMKDGGRIVNVSAKPGVIFTEGKGMAAYGASKAAVAAMSASLGAELAGRGIWVNAVVPSIMDTPANRESMPDADHDDWPKVEEVAHTILFLASPANEVTRSALVPVYGRS